MNDFISLAHGSHAVALDLRQASPVLIHYGAPLAGAIDRLVKAREFPVGMQAGTDETSAIDLLPQAALGFPARPGVEGRRANGADWAPRFVRAEVRHDPERNTVGVRAVDPDAGLEQRSEIEMVEGGVIRTRAAVVNTGSTPYALDAVTLTVQLPGWGREVMQLGGRWSNEFLPRRRELVGAIEVENRAGRTSHDRFPAMFIGEPGFTEARGLVWGAHFAWSGNSRLRVEVLGDGRRVLQAGEALLPGELTLQPTEEYVSPWLYLSASDAGLNGVSAGFHEYLRSRPEHPRTDRPVLLNTWEAVYFNHDLETLQALADRAAAIGVERFVLDDGWFRHRRSDTAGLGDWFVDETVWPEGLGPLVDHVRGHGMEFGLWFEPEMVNPDSDLYRAHPDWALVPAGHEAPLWRHQLVLDLANADVENYLFERIDAVLSEYDIGYIKWDMNRNLVAPTHEARASVHHQTHAFYRLVDRVRSAHPAVEIESCASGGGRADFEVLARTDRVWTSDCNDALDRHRIQRGFSYLFPPELMGAHIGPPRSHTTGRTHDLAFRSGTALCGHLGIEWNVLTADDDQLADLASLVATHKRFRPLLHSGDVLRLDTDDPALSAHMVRARDRRNALVFVAQVSTAESLAVAPLRIPGLDPTVDYRIEEIALPEQPPGKAMSQPEWISSSISLTGDQLGAGIQLPILNPESIRILSITG